MPPEIALPVTGFCNPPLGVNRQVMLQDAVAPGGIGVRRERATVRVRVAARDGGFAFGGGHVLRAIEREVAQDPEMSMSGHTAQTVSRAAAT